MRNSFYASDLPSLPATENNKVSKGTEHENSYDAKHIEHLYGVSSPDPLKDLQWTKMATKNEFYCKNIIFNGV